MVRGKIYRRPSCEQITGPAKFSFSIGHASLAIDGTTQRGLPGKRTLLKIYSLIMVLFNDLKQLVSSLWIGIGSPIQKCGTKEDNNTLSFHTQCSNSLQT